VHAARIEPDKERLLVAVGTVDEVKRGVEKLLVNILHALLCQWAGILAVLLAPFAEAGVLSWIVRECCCASEDAAGTKAQLEF
jgi:hypothetical protein